MRPALERRIAELGLAKRFVVPGFRSDLDSLIAAADIVTLPSTVAYAKMDYPLVLLEAMALARPVVVATDTPAAELAEAGAALAVTPDETTLGEVFGRLFDDQAEREALGRAARAAARERFGRERMAQAYELLYDGLLAG